MNRVWIGLLLAMAALILLHGNQPLLGFPAFVVGIYLMMQRK